MDRHVVQFEYITNTSGAERGVASLTKQLYHLNQQLLTTGGALGKNLSGQLNSAFSSDIRALKGFSTQLVALETQGMKLGKAMESNSLTLSKQTSLLRDYRAGAAGARGAITELAKEQVRMSKSVVTMYEDKSGRKMARVSTPTGIDMTNQANIAKVAGQEMQIYNRLLQQNAEQIVNWGKNTQWAGRQIMVGMTIPIAMFGQAAKQTFIEVDRELTRLGKVYGATLSGVSNEATAAIRSETMGLAKELASEWGVAAKDTAGIAADIAATGKQGEDLLNSTREAMRLSVLGEVDRQEAMKATLAMQSAFGLSNKELSKSINFLNAVENQTSTSLSDLIEAIPRTGPVIRALGGDITDLAAMLTAMREGGVEAAEGANAIKSGLASLINPTKQAAEQAEAFGIDIVGIVQKNKGQLMPTVLEFKKALETLPDFERGQLIETVFGKYQLSRLTALFDNIGSAGSQTEEVFKLAGASAAQLAAVADKELTALTESTSKKWERAVESFKTALLPIGEFVTTVFTKVVNVATKMLDAFNDLPGPLKALFKLLAGAGALVGPILMIAGIFGNFLGNLMKGWAFLKGKRGGLFSMITADTAAAASASAGLTEAKYNENAAMQQVNETIEKQIKLLQALAGASAGAGAAGLRAMAEDRGMVAPAIEGNRVRGDGTGPNNGTIIGNFEQAGTGVMETVRQKFDPVHNPGAQKDWSPMLDYLDEMTPEMAKFSDEAAKMAADALVGGVKSFDGDEFRRQLGDIANSTFSDKKAAKKAADVVSAGMAHMLDQAAPAGVKADWTKQASLPRKSAHSFPALAAALHTSLGGAGFSPGIYEYGHGAIPKVMEGSRGLFSDSTTAAVQLWQDKAENSLLNGRPRPGESSGAGLRATGGSNFMAWILAEKIFSGGHADQLMGAGAMKKISEAMGEYFGTDPVGADARRRTQTIFQDASLMQDAESKPLGDTRRDSERLSALNQERRMAKAEINTAIADQKARAEAYANSDTARNNLFGAEGKVRPGMTEDQQWEARRNQFSSVIEQTGKKIAAAGADFDRLSASPIFSEAKKAGLSSGITKSLEGLRDTSKSQVQQATLVKGLGTTSSTISGAVQELVSRGDTTGLQSLREKIMGLGNTKNGVSEDDISSLGDAFDKLVGQMDESIQKRKASLEKARKRVSKLESVRARAEMALADAQAAGDRSAIESAKQRLKSARRNTRRASRRLGAIEADTAAATERARLDAAAAATPAARGRRARNRLGSAVVGERAAQRVGVAATAAMGAAMFTDNKIIQKWSVILLGLSMIVPLLQGAGKMLMSAAANLNRAAISNFFGPGGRLGGRLASARGAFAAAPGASAKMGVALQGIGRGIGMLSAFLGPAGWAAIAIGGLAAVLWKIHDNEKKRQERERRGGSLSLDLLGISGSDYSSRVAAAGTGVDEAQTITIKDELKEDESFKKMVEDAKASGDAVGYLTERYRLMAVAIKENTALTDEDRKAAEARAKTIYSLSLQESNVGLAAFEIHKKIADIRKDADRDYFFVSPEEARRIGKTGSKVDQARAAGDAAVDPGVIDGSSSNNKPSWVPTTEEEAGLEDYASKVKEILGDFGAIGTTMADSFKLGDSNQALDRFLRQVIEVNSVAKPTGDEFADWKAGIAAADESMGKTIEGAESYDEAVNRIIDNLGIIPENVRTVWTIEQKQEFVSDLINFEKIVNTKVAKLFTDIKVPEVSTKDVEASYEAQEKAANRAAEAAQERQDSEKEAIEKTIEAKEKQIEGIEAEQEAIQETIEKIEEEADRKRKALEEAKEASDFARDMRQADIDYYDALAKGDYAGAASVQNDRLGMIEQQSFDDANDQIDSDAEKAVEAEEAKIDAKQKTIDLINVEIDKIRETLEAKQKTWDAENKRHQKALSQIRENRDAAIEGERKKQEAVKKTYDDQIKKIEEVKTATIASLLDQAKQNDLTTAEIIASSAAAADEIGKSLGWSPTQVAKFKQELIDAVLSGYAGALTQVMTREEFAALNLKRPGGKPYKYGELHTGGHVGSDETSGRGGLKSDEVTRTLQVDEFVVQKKAVKKYGRNFMENINSMKMHTGGIVSKPTRLGMAPMGKAALHHLGAKVRDAAGAKVVAVTAPMLKAYAEAKYGTRPNTDVQSGSIPVPTSFASRDTGSLKFGAPLPGGSWVQRSGYGWRIHPIKKKRTFHYGLDLAAPAGTPIFATESGIVSQQEVMGKVSGNALRVAHGAGWDSRYLHMSQFVAGLGDRVSKGQMIGKVGTTGLSTGNHLHFEMRKDGSTLDPRSVVPLRAGGEILRDGALARLHKGEIALTAPLSSELREGIRSIKRQPDVMGSGGTSGKQINNNNSYSIQVTAAPGMSEEAVANAVFAKIERKEARMGFRS